MSDYRFEFVERNGLDCLHVMIDSNSLKEIADTHIPLDDILEAATAQGYMAVVSPNEREIVQALAENVPYTYPDGFAVCVFCGSSEDHGSDCLITKARAVINKK